MKCLICSSLCNSFEDMRWGVLYYECDSCHLIMKSPKHLSNFKEQKKRYDLHQNSSDSSGYRAYFERFIDFVLPLEPKPLRGLDFGCGATSLLADILAEHDIGTDFYDPIYHSDRVYESRVYDLIVSVEVFEHLHDPKTTFGMLVEHLAVDGYIAIQTALRPDSKEEFLNWYYRLDPTHVLFFSINSLEVLASEFGMRVIKSDKRQMVLMKRRRE